MTELEELTNLKILDKNNLYKKEFETIEKELKAFEIIKKKNVAILNFKFIDTLEEYNFNYAGYDLKELTQEEFDLLKEVLK